MQQSFVIPGLAHARERFMRAKLRAGGVKSRSTIGAPLIAFAAVGAVLIPFYRFALGPDAISYLSIASDYAAGYWREAINAYWGPLSSWCLAVFLLARVPGLIAIRIVSLASGVLTLAGLYRLSIHFKLDKWLRRTFLWVGALMVLAFTVSASVPDLLLTAIVLFYLAIILGPGYASSPYGGVLCGVLGGLAYLAKSYGFYFFAVHFTLCNVNYWAAQAVDERRRVLRRFLAGVVIFAAISFGWAATLHAKYGNWMVSTTGEFNHRLIGPESSGYPHLRRIIPPTSDHAVTSWQDPSPSWLPAWSAFASSSTFKHQLKVVYANSKLLAYFWNHTTILFVAILLGYVALSLNSPVTSEECIRLLGTVVVFAGGYLLITVQDRYFWLADLLLLLIAFRTLELVFTSGALNHRGRAFLNWITILSFVAGPLVMLRSQALVQRNLYLRSESIKHSGAIRGRFASCSDWPDSAYLAYLLGVPYFGVPVASPEADDAARELNPDYAPGMRRPADPKSIAPVLAANSIGYLVLWPDCPPMSSGLDWSRLGTAIGHAGDVRVLRLPDAGTR